MSNFSFPLPKVVSNSIAFASMIFSSACATTDKNLPSQPVDKKVNLQKFMGRWYVIASHPTTFEKGAVNATETYSWNKEKERVDIDFRFHQDSPSGKEKTIPQKGFIDNPTTNAEWKIEPIWPLKFGYLIVYLNDDYSATAIGTPGRDHVWIMAREPRLDEKTYNQIAARLRELGYDLAQVQRVPQIWN